MKKIYKNFTIHYYDEVDSTNKIAYELMNSGIIGHKHIILANKQTCAYGKEKRKWHSPEGNIYFSLSIAKEKEEFYQLVFLSVISLGSALQNISCEINIRYKWPNDLILNNKKLSGILVENKHEKYVIIGIGINLRSSPMNKLLTYPATSLLEENIDIHSQKLLEIFLDNFEIFYQKWLKFGFPFIRNLWMEKAYKLNKEIKLIYNNKKIISIFRGIDDKGSILVEYKRKILKISSTEIY